MINTKQYSVVNMTTKERKQFLTEMDSVQNEIKTMQYKLNKNPYLLKDAAFQEQRTKLFYKAYCIDCTLGGELTVSYNTYLKGE